MQLCITFHFDGGEKKTKNFYSVFLLVFIINQNYNSVCAKKKNKKNNNNKLKIEINKKRLQVTKI